MLNYNRTKQEQITYCYNFFGLELNLMVKLLKKQNLQNHNTSMSNAMTLHDLSVEKLDIFCWCNNCGHNNVIETKKIMNKLGQNYPVPKVGYKLRCGKCNNTDNISTRPNWLNRKGQLTRHML